MAAPRRDDTSLARLSYRRLGDRAQIPHTTLYQWASDPPGHPKKDVYPASVNNRLARALGLDPFAHMIAGDQSAVAFGGSDNASALRATQEQILRIRKSRKASFTTEEVLCILEKIVKSN